MLDSWTEQVALIGCALLVLIGAKIAFWSIVALVVLVVEVLS